MSTEGEEVALPVVVDDKKSEAENAKKLGNDAFANKKFDEAIVLYNQAIQLDPDNAVFYSNRR
jgi:Flp pilus assembly protein TadD